MNSPAGQASTTLQHKLAQNPICLLCVRSSGSVARLLHSRFDELGSVASDGVSKSGHPRLPSAAPRHLLPCPVASSTGSSSASSLRSGRSLSRARRRPASGRRQWSACGRGRTASTSSISCSTWLGSQRLPPPPARVEPIRPSLDALRLLPAGRRDLAGSTALAAFLGDIAAAGGAGRGGLLLLFRSTSTARSRGCGPPAGAAARAVLRLPHVPVRIVGSDRRPVPRLPRGSTRSAWRCPGGAWSRGCSHTTAPARAAGSPVAGCGRARKLASPEREELILVVVAIVVLRCPWCGVFRARLQEQLKLPARRSACPLRRCSTTWHWAAPTSPGGWPASGQARILPVGDPARAGAVADWGGFAVCRSGTRTSSPSPRERGRSGSAAHLRRVGERLQRQPPTRSRVSASAAGARRGGRAAGRVASSAPGWVGDGDRSSSGITGSGHRLRTQEHAPQRLAPTPGNAQLHRAQRAERRLPGRHRTPRRRPDPQLPASTHPRDRPPHAGRRLLVVPAELRVMVYPRPCSTSHRAAPPRAGSSARRGGVRARGLPHRHGRPEQDVAADGRLAAPLFGARPCTSWTRPALHRALWQIWLMCGSRHRGASSVQANEADQYRGPPTSRCAS